MSLKAIDFKATNLYNEVNNLKGGAFVKYYVGIDIGGTTINIGILNGENQLVASKVTPVPAKKDCESVLSLAAATLDLLCEEMGIQKRELISVGIGVPVKGHMRRGGDLHGHVIVGQLHGIVARRSLFGRFVERAAHIFSRAP